MPLEIILLNIPLYLKLGIIILGLLIVYILFSFILNRLKSITKDSLWDNESFMHTLFHVGGAMSPFLIILIVSIFTPTEGLWKYIIHGDFCLFSAAILTPAAYSFHKFKAKNTTTSTGNFQRLAELLWPISLVLIGISSILFVLIYIHENYSDFKIHETTIGLTSIAFLLLSFFIYYLSRYIYKEPPPYDENDMQKHSDDEFASKYKGVK